MWELRVDGKTLVGITAAPVDYYSALIVLAPKPENAGFAVRCGRFVTEGAHEDVVVVNLEARERRLELELRFEADFADIMEAQSNGSIHDAGARSIKPEPRSTTLSYECGGFRRGTQIEFSGDCSVHQDRAVFDVVLEPHGEWRTCVDIVALVGDTEARPLLRRGSFHAPEPEMPLTPHCPWQFRACSLSTRLRAS